MPSTADLASAKARAVARAAIDQGLLDTRFSALLDPDAQLVELDHGAILIVAGQLFALTPPNADIAGAVLALCARYDINALAIVFDAGTSLDREAVVRHLQVTTLDITAIDLDAGALAPTPAVAIVAGKPGVPQQALDVTPSHIEMLTQQADSVGATLAIENEIVRIEILGLEIARLDPETQQLHVGVGINDRLARFDGAAEAFADDDLTRTANHVHQHRFAGSESLHPLATLARNRWLRHIALDVDTNLWRVDPARVSPGLQYNDTVALTDGSSLQVFCALNDLSAVSAAAVIRRRELGRAPMTLNFAGIPSPAVTRQVALLDESDGPVEIAQISSPWST